MSNLLSVPKASPTHLHVPLFLSCPSSISTCYRDIKKSHKINVFRVCFSEVVALTCLHESIFSGGIIKVSKILSYVIPNPITIQQGKSYSLKIKVLFKSFQQEKLVLCAQAHTESISKGNVSLKLISVRFD